MITTSAKVFGILGIAVLAVFAAAGCGDEAQTGTRGAAIAPACNSDNASTGTVCTEDCVITCGFNQLGTKTCMCDGGYYSSCPCPRPEEYQGALTAPLCDTADGTTTSLKNGACETEWQQCIGTDPITGNTPRGCVCMRHSRGNLQWYCGSTNKWFALE
jgi:hypothetical protein